MPGWVTVELVELELDALPEPPGAVAGVSEVGLLEVAVPDGVVVMVESGTVHAVVNSRQPSSTGNRLIDRRRRGLDSISGRVGKPKPR